MQRRLGWRARGYIVALVCMFAFACFNASAHILPYFSWFSIDRRIEVTEEQLRLTYDCRLRTDYFNQGDPLIDSDGDGTASPHELALFFLQAAQYFSADMIIGIENVPIEPREESFAVRDDNKGFRSVVVADMPQITSATVMIQIFDPTMLPFGFESTTMTLAAQSSALAADKAVKLLDDAGTKVDRLSLPSEPHTTFTISLASQ